MRGGDGVEGVGGGGGAFVRAVSRSLDEVEAIARAGAVVNEALRAALGVCCSGRTTAEVDEAAGRVIRERGGAALFRGYRQGGAPPFPGDACVSVNEEVVHGVPSGSRVLAPGDLVSVDVGVRLGGWCADSAATVVVGGGGDGGGRDLISATRGVLGAARDLMEPGIWWSSVAMEMERLTRHSGFGFVAEFVGHGIGRELHESPKAPSYWAGYAGPDFELREGVVLAVEPLLASGAADRLGRVGVEVAEDGWTVRLRGGGVACHEECVLAVAPGGGRVLSGISLDGGV